MKQINEHVLNIDTNMLTELYKKIRITLLCVLPN